MKNRTIESQQAINEIIHKCDVCHVGMVDQENKPYVLPFNFGFENGIIYLHSAPEGKKITVLEHNDQVCIAFSTDYVLRYQHEEVACSWSMRYRSVLVYGKAEFVEGPEEKINILNVIMAHYVNRKFDYNAPAIREVMVFKVKVEKMEGRVYGY